MLAYKTCVDRRLQEHNICSDCRCAYEEKTVVFINAFEEVIEFLQTKKRFATVSIAKYNCKPHF